MRKARMPKLNYGAWWDASTTVLNASSSRACRVGLRDGLTMPAVTYKGGGGRGDGVIRNEVS